MARPVQKRMVETVPEYDTFHPEGISSGQDIVLTTDEYETIRLLDKEHLSQEECATVMGVSRPTISSIYQRAREKIALSIVDGRRLLIKGGAYCIKNKNVSDTSSIAMRKKGEKEMRIAVTYDNGEIFQHFGRTENFKIYDTEDGKVVSSSVVGTNGQGHGALAGVLKGLNVDILICGGIGGGAQNAVASMGIRLCGGVSGDADSAVEAFLSGNLESSSSPTCGHHHHDEGHNCSGGGCGGHCHH
ncbi:MAG: DUF134 domain-containing protein [Candidatus Ornithospirochaeta sp.]